MTASMENDSQPELQQEAKELDFLPPIETVCCGRKWFGICGFCGLQDDYLNGG